MKSHYLTPESWDKMRSELRQLLEIERPQIVRAVSEAAAMGDRSENAEYIYGKRRLREIDRRIRFLQKRLQEAEVVDPAALSLERVSFGLWVEVLDAEGLHHWFQVVGADEIDPQGGRITHASPLGRALLGKEVGDEIRVQRPKGVWELEILQIAREKK